MQDFLTLLKELDQKLTGFIESKDKDIEGLKQQVKDLEKRVVALLASQKEQGVDDPYAAFKSQEEAAKFIEFAKAVFTGDVVQAKTMSEGVDSEGGYLVPEEFRATLIRLVETYGDARKVATVLPMGKDELRIPKLVSGVTVYWVNEGANITPSTPTFGRVNLVAKKLAALVPVTSELLEDSSISIANLLANLFAEAMAEEEDRVAFTGSTSGGDPFDGVLYASGVNQVIMAETSFDAINADYLLDLTSAVPSAAAKRGTFVLHRTVFDKVRKLKDSNGDYIWQKPSAAAPGTIWGYPYIVTDVMPGMADSGPNKPFVFFGDLRQIYIGDRRKMSIAQSSHVGFTQDLIYLKATERVAMSVALPDAFAVLVTSGT